MSMKRQLGIKPTKWRFPNYYAHLPDHYYKYRQELLKPSTRFHERPRQAQYLDYIKNPETGEIERLKDVAIPVTYPPEANKGIWGGEGVVKGYVKLRNFFEDGWPKPRWWFPNLKQVVYYSEILDKYFRIITTEHAMQQIDEKHGFDNYILRTPVQDLKSQLAYDLRRHMYLKLFTKDFHNDNPKKQKEVFERYKDCIIPKEQAEWFGLAPPNAMMKQKNIEARANRPIPLKVKYSQQLLQELQGKGFIIKNLIAELNFFIIEMKTTGEIQIEESQKSKWAIFNKLKFTR